MRIGYSEERRLSAEAFTTELHPDTCDVCAYIERFNTTGLDGESHCRGCCAVFPSGAGHCSKCHRTFSTPGTFSKHLVPFKREDGEMRVRCLDPSQVLYYGEPKLSKRGIPIFRGHDGFRTSRTIDETPMPAT